MVRASKPAAPSKSKPRTPPFADAAAVVGDDYASLTLADVAKALRVSQATIHNLVARGEFPRAIAVGSKLRWPKAVVLEWIRTRGGMPAAAASSAQTPAG